MKHQDDNSQKFAQLVREHKSTIYTVCYMFSHDEEEVNDLFQETLINMWKGIGLHFHFKAMNAAQDIIDQIED